MENIHSYTFRLHKIEYDGEWLQQKTSIENHSPMHESIAIEQSEDKRQRDREVEREHKWKHSHVIRLTRIPKCLWNAMLFRFSVFFANAFNIYLEIGCIYVTHKSRLFTHRTHKLAICCCYCCCVLLQMHPMSRSVLRCFLSNECTYLENRMHSSRFCAKRNKNTIETNEQKHNTRMKNKR